MAPLHSFCFLSLLLSVTIAAPATQQLDQRQLGSQYAPVPASCPNTALVRPANGISTDEANYYSARRTKADAGLAAWLAKQGTFSTDSQPSVGFASSGGGYRALLEAAGVIQVLDGRDTNASTGGLYQGLTYESGLSGGSWFLSSLSGNNWPTVSSLQKGLWEDAFQNSLLLPANIMNTFEYTEVTSDLTAKKLAGFDDTIVDAWGRLLSYGFFYGSDGGVGIKLSTLTTLSNFTSFNVPYPIITALGIDNSYNGQCSPTLNATQYEFSAYEYGSWDQGVSAFASTKYMGSKLTNGQPTQPGKCIQNYDNLGYVFGTSSNVFSAVCEPVQPIVSEFANTINFLEGLVNETKSPEFKDLFALYPNPFYKYPQSSRVSDQPVLTMVDGGVAGQNVPIWPFLHPGRNVDVLILGDNSADTADYFPNGTEIHQTYLNAQAAGLTKMPFIPDADTFVSKGLNKRATFFGCDSTNNETIFLVWLPNVNYTYPSNTPTLKIQYSKDETRGMIANGNAIGTQNGEEGWSFCLACAIKNRDGNNLPNGCKECFDKYCFRQ